MQSLQTKHPDVQAWDVTAFVRGIRTSAEVCEALAAMAPTLGRIACPDHITKHNLLRVRKTIAWDCMDERIVAVKLRDIAISVWRAFGMFKSILVTAIGRSGDIHFRQFGLTDYMLSSAGSYALPQVTLELEVCTYDGQAEQVRVALDAAHLWRWESQPYGLLGQSRCPMPLPFGRFMGAISDLVWRISPGAGILAYVHAAGEHLAVERTLGLPEYHAWARTRRLTTP